MNYTHHTIKLIIALVISAMLLLTSCQINTSLQQCFGGKNEVETETCLTNTAREIKDPKICRFLPTKQEARACYEGIALGLKNPVYCTIVGGRSRTFHWESCLFHLAREYNDSSICEEFKNPYFITFGHNNFERCLQLIDGTLENPRYVERPDLYDEE